MLHKLLQGKPASEKAKIKGQEIAKIKSVRNAKRKDYDIEIIDIKPIKKGVEVFARAWDKNGQIGFGTDGSIDIERFVIVNPPVLVDDPNGTIIREWTDDTTGKLKQIKLREDTKEAILQSLEHTIKIKNQKFGADKIVSGKVGNTTSTIYADSNTLRYGNGPDTSWTNAVNTSPCDAYHNSFTEHTFFTNDLEAGSYYCVRTRNSFDTSGIGSDTINSATFSAYTTSYRNDAGVSFYIVDGNTTASSNGWNEFGSVDWGNTAWSNWSTTGQYNSVTLNTTGESNINTLGTTYLGIRGSLDFNASTPTNRNFGSIRYADYAGTSSDPKLVIEHSGATTPTLMMMGMGT